MERGNVFKHETLTSAESLDIAVNRVEEGTIVRLRGRLGIDSSPDLRDCLLAVLHGEPPKTVVVDLTDVSYVDTSAIATLLEALKIARSRQITLCVKGLQSRLVRLFELTGLMTLFETSGCKGIHLEQKVH
jgi:anti-sigma B factor antagonist